MHPSRLKLAGRPEGALYDRLLAAQAELARGEDGTGKPMQCPAGMLAKVSRQKPRDMQELERLIGQRHAERFGAAFLDVLGDP